MSISTPPAPSPSSSITLNTTAVQPALQQLNGASLTAKRKRSETADNHNFITSVGGIVDDEQDVVRAQKTIRDIWDILKSNDETLATVEKIDAKPPLKQSKESSTEHSAKRTKLDHADDAERISIKIEKNTYMNVEDFVADVDSVCTKVIEEAHPSTIGTQWKFAAGDLEQDRLIANVNALRKLVKTLARHEAAWKVLSRGGITEQDESPTSSRAVLTLFGNAQGHKQLFSSFQQPPSGSAQPIIPLRENGLPNGILSTRIVPIKAEDVAITTKPNSFVETFAPPPTLPSLLPPKPPKGPTNQQPSTIIWGSSREQRPERPLGYAHQRLHTGQWLGYNGTGQQRDRTQSASEVAKPLGETGPNAHAVAEEDALFRSVYSSFAPSRDNTGAIYPDGVKGGIWWQKVGKQVLEQSLGIAIAQEQLTATTDTATDSSGDDELTRFSKAVEAFDPELLDIKMDNMEVDSNPAAKDDQALLDEISSLLESLHSYQRIRNASTTLTQALPNSLSALRGAPDAPTQAETETYNTLRAQISLLVATLPPYAVSKLNGDQLSDLAIRPTIRLSTPTIRGVMEEDPASRAAKALALSSTLGVLPAQNRASAASMSTPAGARTAPMTTGRTGGHGYGQSSATNLVRQQSGGFNPRTPLSGWQTPGQGQGGAAAQSHSATGPRAGFSNTNAAGALGPYGSQSARPAHTTNLRSGLAQFQNGPNRGPASQGVSTNMNGNTYPGRTTLAQTLALKSAAGAFDNSTSLNSRTQPAQAALGAFRAPQQAPAHTPGLSYLSHAAQSASPAPIGIAGMQSQVGGPDSRPLTPGGAPMMGGAAPMPNMIGDRGTSVPQAQM